MTPVRYFVGAVFLVLAMSGSEAGLFAELQHFGQKALSSVSNAIMMDQREDWPPKFCNKLDCPKYTVIKTKPVSGFSFLLYSVVQQILYTELQT